MSSRSPPLSELEDSNEDLVGGEGGNSRSEEPVGSSREACSFSRPSFSPRVLFSSPSDGEVESPVVSENFKRISQKRQVEIATRRRAISSWPTHLPSPCVPIYLSRALILLRSTQTRSMSLNAISSFRLQEAAQSLERERERGKTETRAHLLLNVLGLLSRRKITQRKEGFGSASHS